jgi:hypothetical protein
MSNHDEPIGTTKTRQFKVPANAEYLKFEKGVERSCPVCAEMMCSCKQNVNDICESCEQDWQRQCIKAGLSNWQQKKRWERMFEMIVLGQMQREPMAGIVIR